MTSTHTPPTTAPRRRSRATKAAVASSLALVAGLSSFGGFAVWHDLEEIQPGTVQSGHARLDQGTNTGTWADQAGNVIDITGHAFVPGETIVYTETVDLDIVGASYVGYLSTSAVGLAPAPFETTHTYTVLGTGETIVGTLPVDASYDGDTVEVRVDVTLPAEDQWGTDTQDQAVALQTIEVELNSGQAPVVATVQDVTVSVSAPPAVEFRETHDIIAAVSGGAYTAANPGPLEVLSSAPMGGPGTGEWGMTTTGGEVELYIASPEPATYVFRASVYNYDTGATVSWTYEVEVS